MKTISKIILLSSLVVARSAQATVLFQNGFENRPADSVMNNGTDGFGVDFSGDSRNVTKILHYRAALNGITPPEGAKMLEWSPPSIPGAISFNHGGLGSELYKVRGQHRFMQASIKFWVGSGDLDDKELKLYPQINSVNYRTFLNLKTGAWRTATSVTWGDRSGTAAILRNSWNTISMSHDFEDWRMRVSLNGSTLAETKSGFVNGNEEYIRNFTITLTQLSDVSATYDPNMGGPVMYLDDYRVDAVPEPSSIVALTGCFVAFFTFRRRSSGHEGNRTRA